MLTCACSRLVCLFRSFTHHEGYTVFARFTNSVKYTVFSLKLKAVQTELKLILKVGIKILARFGEWPSVGQLAVAACRVQSAIAKGRYRKSRYCHVMYKLL